MSSTREQEEKEIPDSKFDEQAFLIHYYDQFIKANSKETYDNFVQIQGEPGVIINKLLGTGVSEFFNITQDQLSLLQPKIKIYKTVYSDNGEEKDILLKFSEFVSEKTIQNILLNRGQRGAGIGLKKFEWEDMGTNPGDTGKAFKATLILHLQSITDLFEEQEEGVSFADLIRTPPTKFNSRGQYNNKSFRIKIQLGWQVPTDKSNSILTPILKKAIENSTIILFLTLTDHEIDIQQDGSVFITANYIGALEGKLLSSETDILYIDSDIKSKLDRQEKLLLNAKQRKKEIEERSNTKSNRDSRTFFEKLSSFDFRSEDDLELQGVETEIEERLELKENIERENKALSYKRFLTNLEKNGKIFFIDLDQQDINNFNILKKNTSNKEELKERNKNIDQRRKEVKNVNIKVHKYEYIDPSNIIGSSNLKESLTETVLQKDKNKREKALNDLNRRFTETKVAKKDNKVRINFIYLGDIINTALSVLLNKERGKDLIIEDDFKKNFRFLMGPIEIYNKRKDQREIIDLCDIPISLDLFNAWFLKKVIRPQLDKYLLRDFLKDISSELILKALNPDPNSDYSKVLRNKISFSVFNFSHSENDPFGDSNNFGNKRININDISSVDRISSMRSGNPSKVKQYFLMYIPGFIPSKLKGNYEEDIKNGIYHLVMGSDRGLVKRINFSRADIQYVKEARIVDSEQVKKGDAFLVEPYNAKVSLWGTSVFKPGMMVYIDPRSIGIPKSVPRTKRLPVGGYYTIIKVFSEIESGVFNTSIDLNFETDEYNNVNALNFNNNSETSERSIDSI